MIQAQNIQLRLGQSLVLDQISVSLKPSELVVLLGANGAGKSSLLHILAGSSEHAHQVEALSYDGEVGLTIQQLAQRRAVLAQQSVVPFALSVAQVVEMGLYPFEQLLPTQSAQLIQEAMTLAGIPSLQQRQLISLSGGEQQRVHFARVLVQVLAQRELWPERASYLFLDEPLNALDPKYQHELMRAVRELTRAHPIGVLMVLHDVNIAAYYADRLVLLDAGQILVDAVPREALSEENLSRLFGLGAYIMEHPLNKEKTMVVWRDA
ncbi:MAG: ATP-binding cassette domain-containing protein [Pelistega sp.]|nr:ATP-binding cassette domain-containing protein [Pelistega sp.]